MNPELDIIIPVYNEGQNIIRVLDALAEEVRTPFRVLICFDRDDDDTLPVIRGRAGGGTAIELVRNQGRGALGAILSGFAASSADAVLVMPADDDYNAGRLDGMVRELAAGADLVAASRFMPGGCMVGCPWVKAILVRTAAFLLRHLARLPTRDPTNGFRLFSRRLVHRVPIESKVGFAFSLELLVKCHRLGWKVRELPAHWYERKQGKSRFRVFRWAPQYLVWVRYALATTYLRRGPATVTLRPEQESRSVAQA